MDAGATIGMDRFGMEHVLPDEARVRTVLALLRLGYADRMVLSHDAAFFSRRDAAVVAGASTRRTGTWRTSRAGSCLDAAGRRGHRGATSTRCSCSTPPGCSRPAPDRP